MPSSFWYFLMMSPVITYFIKLSSIRSKGRYSFLCFQEKDTTLSQNSMLFSLRHHIIPYSLYFFNLSFYPISEKRCTFAAQFMKDRNLVIQKHDKRKQRTSVIFYSMGKNERINSEQEMPAEANKDHSADADRVKEVYKVTIAGSIINVVLLVLKFAAGILGHSAAMIADAIHSLTDFATDVVVLVFVKLGNKPMDKDHDYGHGKYETLATAIIGISLFVVGVMICYSGVTKTYRAICGETLQQPGIVALIAAIVSVVMKEWAYQFTVKAGKKYHSEAVVANAWHHRSDALSSIGTMFGIGGAIILGEKWAVLDPLAAIIVSAFIIKAAWGLVMQSVKELTDASLPETEEDEILKIANGEQGVGEIHNLRTRRIGNKIAIEMHVRMPGSLSLYEAHEHATHIETKLKQHFGADTHVGIHLEPIKVNGKYQKPE